MEKIPYIHFTEDQKRRASEVDLEQFLLRRGEKLIPSGHEKRLSSDHSITVRGNSWYDHAEEKESGPISFLQKFYGLTYPESITQLLNGEQGMPYEPVRKQPLEEKKSFSLPPASPTMRRVYAYLLQHRGISRAVLDAFVHAKLIYENAEPSADGTKEYHNAVFIGCDSCYSFHCCGADDQLYAFEAPVDMLSFITLHPEGWHRHSYVSL